MNTLVFAIMEPIENDTPGDASTSQGPGRTRGRCRPMSVYLTCPVCSSSFPVKASHADKRIYCSRDCMATAYRERLKGDANPNHKNAGWHACERCGAEFHAYRKSSKYCSIACRTASQVGQPSPKPKRQTPCFDAKAYRQRKLFNIHELKRKFPARPCRDCGFRFTPRVGGAHFCRDCDQRRRARTCVSCGAPFEAESALSKRTTCSVDCSRQHRADCQRGEKSHRWRGGLSRDVTIRRGSFEYSDWRSAVFARDDFSCVLCGQRGGRLSAHHIKTVEAHPELMLDVSNGVTLCWPCHTSIRWKEERYEPFFRAYVAAFLRAGAGAVIARPADLDDVIDALKEGAGQA